MPSIQAVASVLPGHAFSIPEISEIGRHWLKDEGAKYEKFERLLRSSGSTNRHFALSGEQLLQLNGMQHRHELFEEHAPKLGVAATDEALKRAGRTPSDLSTFLFTSCSCPTIPAIDTLILEHSKFPATTRRVPVYQYGCAGGVAGLRLASDLSKDGSTIALSSVELCSLVFQPRNTSPAQLVGSAFFADGAATAIISPADQGLSIQDHQSYLIPNSRHLMGYDVFDDGFHLRLDRELPQLLATTAPDIVRNFLARQGLSVADIKYWLFHPGGQKILSFLDETFDLKPDQARWSREILETVGNLSSATVLFILESFLRNNPSKPGEHTVMMGIGPGLSVELILFQWLP